MCAARSREKLLDVLYIYMEKDANAGRAAYYTRNEKSNDAFQIAPAYSFNANLQLKNS